MVYLLPVLSSNKLILTSRLIFSFHAFLPIVTLPWPSLEHPDIFFQLRIHSCMYSLFLQIKEILEVIVIFIYLRVLVIYWHGGSGDFLTHTPDCCTSRTDRYRLAMYRIHRENGTHSSAQVLEPGRHRNYHVVSELAAINQILINIGQNL